MVPRDYEEFFAALHAHGVRFLVVGAHAVALHARPRATKDLDLWIEATPQNAASLLRAIREFFGGAEVGYTVEDVLDPASILQLGVAPVRIDLMSELPGLPSFEQAWSTRVAGSYGSAPATYLGLDELILAKEAAGRPQDLVDARVLRRARDRRR